MRIIRVMILLLLLSMCRIGYARNDNLYFEHLSPNHLPHTLVWSIYQDQEGFMWFGTYTGLVKYDGATTTIWKADATDLDQVLRSNRIFDMHDDRQGSLWFPTEGGGLHQLDKRTGKVRFFPIDSLQTTRWDVAKAIFEDGQGKLWLSSERGLACFDPATLKYTLHPSPDKQLINFLQQDAQDRLWGVNQEGLWQFDPKTGKYTLLPLLAPTGNKLRASSLHLDAQGVAWIGTSGDGIFRVDTGEESQVAAPYQLGIANKHINPNGLYEADGYLWAATNKGLQRIDTKTHRIVNYTADPALPGSLNSNNVTSMYKDRKGNLWIGMLPGLNKAALLANIFNMHQIIPTPEPFRREENMIASILEDHTGTVWVVSVAGGLYQFNPLTHQLTHIIVNPIHIHQDLKYWPLLEGKEDRLWVGGGYADKALYLYNRHTKTFTRYACEMAVNRLDMDAAGRLWINGLTEGIASFEPLTRQFTYYRPDDRDTTGILPGSNNDLLVSRTGEVWISTSNGLSRLDPKTGQFIHYHPPYRTGDEYMHDLWCLYEDKQGMLWIGSRQGGLNRFDPSTGAFIQFSTQDGLAGNRVTSIVEDEQGDLWLGTDYGLSRFTPASLTFRNFGTSAGLPTIPHFLPNSAHIHNGKLLFGTYNGFVMFHPDSIRDQKAAPPPVYITGFKVLEKRLPVPDHPINLAYDENFLSFEFVAINYDIYEKNQYAYKLEGIDKNWVYSGTRRFASYTDLDPGNYTFRVKGSSNDGIWNEQGASIKITIMPPFWQTWWAYSLYGLLAIALLYNLRQYTVKRERLKHALKLQTLEAEKMHEIDQLKSRFFANISHEFRTPLTLIIGPLEKFLSRNSEESEDKPVYQTMQRNAQRLLHLINQLLDLSKIEAGRMKLEAKPAAIVPFLKAIVLSFSSLAERKQIQLHFKYPTVSPIVYFDADKLEKIMVNLLSNAFKFTPAGGAISVSAHLHPAAEPSIAATFRTAAPSPLISTLELKVQDSGAGIPEDQKEKIFDRFYQTANSQTWLQEGSGIGLSLVRELVELHEGDMLVESQPGKGSCFTVHLPLMVADYEQVTIGGGVVQHDQMTMAATSDEAHEIQVNQIADPIIPHPNTDIPLVLMVEDNADIRHFIRQHLYSAYQVIEASDGLEGYSKAVETIPDLILSDVMMPGMDGVKLCRELKTNEKTAHVPVILLTAKASGGDKIEGLESGADDYIIKPFEASELLVRIKNLIESRKKLREYFSRRITLEPTSVAITSVDEQFLQRVMKIIEARMADASFGVEDFGIELGMSRMQLFRKLKALTNHAPGDFIRTMRLKRAAELLAHGAGNIAEIAFQTGFHDPSYFTKCFQKQYGQTPSEYMAKNLSYKVKAGSNHCR